MQKMYIILYNINKMEKKTHHTTNKCVHIVQILTCTLYNLLFMLSEIKCTFVPIQTVNIIILNGYPVDLK